MTVRRGFTGRTSFAKSIGRQTPRRSARGSVLMTKEAVACRWPVGDAAGQCRYPLLLCFFCEAYREQDVREIDAPAKKM